MKTTSLLNLQNCLGGQTMRVFGIPAVLASMAAVTTVATADTIHVPEDFATIQGAIDAAVDGDEILVGPGTYVENINLLGKAIALRSVESEIVTVIDGNQSGTVITCDSGEGPDTIIEDFTITKGLAPQGGGMRNINSSPTVLDCKFTNNLADGGSDDGGGGVFNQNSFATFQECRFSHNLADGSGGGMYNLDSDLTVVDCAFTENAADDAGGCYTQGGSPQFVDCMFLRNETLAVSGDGGGMSMVLGSPVIVGCVFQENTTNNGDGVGIHVTSASPIIFDCVFVDNVSDGIGGFGGGMKVVADSTPTIIGCVFQQNIAPTTSGGGLYVRDSSVIVLDCTFTENQSRLGGGVNIDHSSSVIIDSSFWSNEATSGGGGLFIDGDGESSTIINCTFADNYACEDGGGLINFLADSSYINCAFVGNSSGSLAGGVYNVVAISTFRSCTFADNTAGIEGGGIFGGERSGQVLTNCILWANTPDPLAGPGALNVTYSNIEGGFQGEGNIDADPLFVDPEGGDYRLAAGSPCIDAGNSTVESPCRLDLDRLLRMFDDPDTADTGVGGPPVIDMGAFEFGSILGDDCNNNALDDACEILQSITPDCNGNGVPDDCDIFNGFSTDCDDNGVPDECDPDCNRNGVADACDIANGDSADRDDNGIPDECNPIGDLNLDGVVDGGDLLILLGSWGPCPPPPFDCPADLDLDDTVGPSDLIILLGNWG